MKLPLSQSGKYKQGLRWEVNYWKSVFTKSKINVTVGV